MGTFGGYIGSCKISEDRIEEFTTDLFKIFYYGGMMHVSSVDMYGKRIELIDPVHITPEKSVDFHYNYFEDTSWENAGYRNDRRWVYSNKIGSAEFNDVIMAAYCLCEHYDEEIGFATMNGDIVSSGWYTGWINNIIKKGFFLGKRIHIWEAFETYVLSFDNYSDYSDDYSDYSLKEALMSMVPVESRYLVGGTELSDLLYIIHGTETLVDGEVIPETYPADVLNCKNVIKKILKDYGKDEGKNKILSIVTQDYMERELEKDEHLKALADITLYIPARVIVYLLCEQLKMKFWNEWRSLRDCVYRDEKMKNYVSAELRKIRESVKESSMSPVSTSEFLRQDGWFTFIDTPDELKYKPKYYLSDADRLYWWDGSDEVVIDDKTEAWLMDIQKQFAEKLEHVNSECDTQMFVKHLIETLYDINVRYKRLFAFQEMFYEFVENGSKREYRAAIDLLCKLYEDNAESGKIIEKLDSWDVGSKSVKCNEGRMNMKRYLSLLANKKLRELYLCF